jgi:hypothetical protein
MQVALTELLGHVDTMRRGLNDAAVLVNQSHAHAETLHNSAAELDK